MEQKQIEKLRILLLKERDKITKMLAKSEKHLKENIYETTGDRKYSYHVADMATGEEIVDRETLFATNLHKRLKEIEEALDRIETEEYGICIKCGENIGYSRLRIVPYAQYCIKCQKEIEEHEHYEF